MEKNIAALLRKDARTVKVMFGNSGQTYTYVTHLALEREDMCVVLANNEWKVVEVVEVHDGVQLEPGDTLKYKWIVCRVDVEEYRANEQRNAEIERVVLDKYKENLRRSFSDQVLAGLPTKDRNVVQRLLKGE